MCELRGLQVGMTREEWMAAAWRLWATLQRRHLRLCLSFLWPCGDDPWLDSERAACCLKRDVVSMQLLMMQVIMQVVTSRRRGGGLQYMDGT